ncbi:MAG: 16S rRNA (adenine(1518)-N(6)/adenine(1519)-N(6))-dimethyltransferase RsmA [bacterium]|nr:16S rRNA (adenine(1518)-N(6)/adenine(1519)-N(6))-dimethyltransferase RsmA [bacterium]
MRHRPKLGQHFLKAKWAARSLAYAVGISPGDTVLEVGPGKGALTRELLAIAKDVGAKVVAIEKDEALVAHLGEIFADEISSGILIVVAGDVRDVYQGETLKSPRSHLGDATAALSGKYVVAANIPYYITGEIIRQFLTAEIQPRTMALLVQKEVAQRVVAKPAGGGSSSGGKESLLSLSVKAYGTPKIVVKVPRGNFSPAPNVDSAILLVENISRDFFSSISEELFFKVIHAGFKSKRKFLLNNLAGTFEKEIVARAFTECGISMKARAEDVPLEKWKALALHLA